MTQFSPPPSPAGSSPLGSYGSRPAPWSAAAIGGFVLSFFGCTIVPAVLGLILGILGIRSTRDSRRRGRGLAIAAIPISLATGLLSLPLTVAAIFFVAIADLTKTLPDVLSASEAGLDRSIPVLRQLATEGFNQRLSDEQLKNWIRKVQEKNGRLMGLEPIVGTQDRGSRSVQFEGKFVNGRQVIEVDLAKIGWRLKLRNIRIGGESLREGP